MSLCEQDATDQRRSRGSLPFALLLIMTVTGMSVAVMPVVISRAANTATTVGRGNAYDAAQSGLAAATAAIRTAGSRANLPCYPTPSAATTPTERALASTVTQGTSSYYVATIVYDVPACTDARSGSTTPDNALITAVGRGRTAAGKTSVRVLQARLPVNFIGGGGGGGGFTPLGDSATASRSIRMAMLGSGTGNFCLDAGSVSPTPGSILRMQRCGSTTAGQQSWWYGRDYQIQLIPTMQAGAPYCIDSGSAPTAGKQLTVQPCDAALPARQRFYYNNTYNFMLAGGVPGAYTMTGMCLNMKTIDVVSDEVIGAGTDCGSATLNEKQSLTTSSAFSGYWVDHGTKDDCSATTGKPCVYTQLHPYQRFSRCLNWTSDGTGTEPQPSDYTFKECVSLPTDSATRTTQKFGMPQRVDGPTGVTGALWTNEGGVFYCLALDSDTYAAHQVCNPKTPTPAQTFTFFGNTGNKWSSYRIVAGSNTTADTTVPSTQKCLGLYLPGNPLDGLPWFFFVRDFGHSRATMRQCVNSTDPASNGLPTSTVYSWDQKWNTAGPLPPELDPYVTTTTSPSPTPTVSSSPTPASTAFSSPRPLVDLFESPNASIPAPLA